MSYESRPSPNNRSTTISKTTRCVQEKASSPLMFDEDLFSADVLTPVNQPSIHNRVISTLRSSEEWIGNAEIKFNSLSSLVHLSMSPIEVITTCAKCDEMAHFNSTENHNRTFSDITETMHNDENNDDVSGLVTQASPKRARLSEPTELAENTIILRKSTYDFLKNLIDDQTKVIDDQLAALHEDSAKHLMLVNYINSSAENLDDHQKIN